MHYFDYAATAPLRECAREAWLEASTALNPASQYYSGRRSRSLLDTAREDIASLLGCEPIEVVFTGSGSEADNIGIVGQYFARTGRTPGRVVVSSIEHPAVTKAAQWLGTQGASVEFLPVNREGFVSCFAALETPATVASCMLANNETGAIQPVQQLIARCQEHDTPVHVDAVQAIGRIPVDFHALGATTLAASAHKFGGPRGVGLLLARRSPAPQAVIHGGGQERGIRSGTVDTAGAYATAAALRAAIAEMETEHVRLSRLREQILDTVKAIPEVIVHTPKHSLSSHLFLSFPGAEADSLIMLLDAQGIEASTGSACHSGVNRASEVLLAQGVEESVARSTLRLTLGHGTSDADVQALCSRLGDVVSRARLAGMA